MNMAGFRNITVTPEDPVEQWGFEGLLAAIERGGMKLWRRIAAEVRRRPHGSVARLLEDEVLGALAHEGERALFQRVLMQARSASDEDAKLEVARRLRRMIERSGLTQREFAAELGTSPSRLSTYVSGKVMPGADVLVRAERVALSPPVSRPPASSPPRRP